MKLEDILRFQLKRVNAFQGLVIDADTWRDAHNYHRDQQRLHVLAFHKTGIVEGLNVSANNPPDMSVTIHSGMAIDPEGNIIIVPQAQNYELKTRKKGTAYLVIQFREIPSEPYQPSDGGQPTRILEGYRIQERDKLPEESYLELARVDFDPAQEAITDAKDPARPKKNEIDLRYQQLITTAEEKVDTAPREVVSPPEVPATIQPQETITLGHVVLGEAGKDTHIGGLKNLIKEINQQERLTFNLEENISLEGDINRCTLIYLTGNGQFELTAEQQATLGHFLEEGNVVFGEGCSTGQDEAAAKGAREFGLAFNQLASQLKRKLETVQRGHPLLSIVHVFSDVPQGAAAGMLLEHERMLYSGSDYGCAWEGGHPDAPLLREVIRSAFEMGANIIAYARTTEKEGRK